MEVTEKWLGDIGGWQAIKAAREYVRLGQVAEVTQDGHIYRGLVGEGRRTFRATLIAAGGMKTEAKCSCNEARRGLICSHAIAVALTVIRPDLVPKTKPQPAAGQVAGAGAAPVSGTAGPAAGLATAAAAGPQVREEDIPPGKFSVHISTAHFSQLPQGTVPVMIQFERSGMERDIPVGRWMLGHALPFQPATPLRLPADDLGSLLEALVDHPRLHATLPGKAGQIAAPNRSAGPKNQDILDTSQDKLVISSPKRWILHSEVDNLRQSVVLQLSGTNSKVVHIAGKPWLFDPEAPGLQPLPVIPAALQPLWQQLLTGAPAQQPLAWVAANFTALNETFELPPGPGSAANIRLMPAQPRFLCRIEGSARRLEAKVTLLHAHYQPGASSSTVASQETHPDANITYPIQDKENALIFYTKNLPAEAAAQRLLASTGFLHTNIPNVLEMKGEREILHFIASDLQKFRIRFELVEGDGFKNLLRTFAVIRPMIKSAKNLSPAGAQRGGSAEPEARSASSNDWLSLEVAYEASDGFHIPRQEVLRLIRSGKADYQGRDGRRYLLDTDSCEELESTLQDVQSRFTGGDHVAVRGRQVEALGAFLPQGSPLLLDPVPMLEEGVLRSRLGSFGAMLRPYQMEGVQWLERHSRSGGGGLLADEMGLGKTVQTLALLKLVLASRAKGAGPALVICPTSLLGNWSDEAARFTPELKTHISHDSKRHAALRKLSEFDVIFTSYALIVRDIEYYKEVQFSAVVLDEASYIRNPDTESAKAVRQLQSAARFTLTGTPVENSVKDIWSIFAFTLPGYLPILDDFQERFVKPLAKATEPKQSAALMERLRRLIRPHILRRTKREVAKDLPEKIEKVLWCELTPMQKQLYQRLLDEGREEIRAARTRSSQGGARMTMFTVLLRLRQVCNDLSLVGIKAPVGAAGTPGSGLTKAQLAASSGKIPVFEELLEETINGGHKALIFSQFVGMLKLLRAKVEALGIPYCYLDGSSTDRPEQVAAFQTNPEKKLFLISLKAGGYGLNLTAADEVVLVDPWWNPAVEAQAIDRAHRIGQGRPVTAYRLVSRGTVEEKILALQSKKRAVMDMALEDDAAVFAGVTDEELDELLR